MHYSASLGWWALAPLAAAVACFRGCPMCWTVGLIETVLARKTGGGPISRTCIDGSCARMEHR
jgi:hypothetical protein